MRPLRNLKIVLGLVLAVAVGGVFAYHFLEGWPWWDSIYMVIITLTTVGYREVYDLSFTGRIITMTILVLGVGLLFVSIGVLTQALLEFELRDFFGRRRMERDIARLSGHYIICGAGRVGRSAARELAAAGMPFIVIEQSEARAAQAPREWLVLVGDATKEETLRQARIDQARGLVAATTADATNIYILLTARTLHPLLKIIARASDEASERHLRTAGADLVISPYGFAGHRIAQAFLRPNVLDFLDIATGRGSRLEVEIEEVQVEPGSPLAGVSIGDSGIHRNMGVIILAIKRDGEMRINPAATDIIHAGDHLIAVGEHARLRRLEETAAVAR
jgi:voltage-gated potassium channel